MRLIAGESTFWLLTYTILNFLCVSKIAVVILFTGLHHFSQGQGFKQWMGDDFKVLMKVYIAAIESFVLVDIVCTFHAFLEFYYLVCCQVISESALDQIEAVLHHFHHFHHVFITGDVPIATTFFFPHQHSMKHYSHLIYLWGAPNGLCFSLTKCKHIKAVK